jgi:hypothetical protein
MFLGKSLLAAKAFSPQKGAKTAKGNLERLQRQGFEIPAGQQALSPRLSRPSFFWL